MQRINMTNMKDAEEARKRGEKTKQKMLQNPN